MNPVRGHYDPPVLINRQKASGAMAEMTLVDCDGGIASAVYRYIEYQTSSNTWLLKLDHIDEWMPPLAPPQRALLYTDNARLPMMDEYGYNVTLEAEQRRREWAEWEAS